MSDNEEKYWDAFYANNLQQHSLELPSQFAVFFLGEAGGPSQIFDVGCGTGRDALFFASQGHNVVGLDRSPAAIAVCTDRSKSLGYDRATFHQFDLANSNALSQLQSWQVGTTAVYARFFVHAITEEEEKTFLRLASELIGDSVLAVEYRTQKDSQQAKVTAAHYRRYVRPTDFMLQASVFGLRCDYFVEGFGFAKYKEDDAHVARMIFRKMAISELGNG